MATRPTTRPHRRGRCMSRNRLRPTLAACSFAAALALSTTANADKGTAEVAFDQARKLMKEGKVAEACPKFEVSFNSDPQVGVLLNLADCHERLGQIATAWAEFHSAIALAKSRNDRRESYAKNRENALAS